MWEALLIEGVGGGILTVLRIAFILVPLLVVLNIARDLGWIEKISEKVYPLFSFVKIPKEAALPLLVGLVFGVVYGAAIIVDAAKEGLIKKRDLLLVGVFLSLNHGVIEDTLIFAAVGANPLAPLFFRFVFSFLVTRLVAQYLDKNFPFNRAMATNNKLN